MHYRYLNDIGECVYLAAAADYVILDPNWYDLYATIREALKFYLEGHNN